MVSKIENTYWVRLYISGPIDIARQVCRERCLARGLCVTIEPTHFIYTGGEVAGYVVGLINYPRFPASREDIDSLAIELATALLERTCQWSALIMSSDKTEWLTVREERPASRT